MLRLGTVLSEFYHALAQIFLIVSPLWRDFALGYSIGGRLRASALEKPAVTTGNCLTYALAQWFQHGGHIISIKSQYGWWCHAYWLSPEGDVYEYAPVEPHRKVKKLWHPLPPLVYAGKERLAPVVPVVAQRKISAALTRKPAILSPETQILSLQATPALRIVR
ncbi:MAG: hypothetical protein ACFBZ9_02660 [Sphingomonadales bacterium]